MSAPCGRVLSVMKTLLLAFLSVLTVSSCVVDLEEDPDLGEVLDELRREDCEFGCAIIYETCIRGGPNEDACVGYYNRCVQHCGLLGD